MTSNSLCHSEYHPGPVQSLLWCLLACFESVGCGCKVLRNGIANVFGHALVYISRLDLSRRAAGLVLLVTVLGGCASTPTDKLQSVARKGGFHESVVSSFGFDHRIFRNQRLETLQQQRALSGRTATTTDQLNVYLEGDGMPWMLRYIVVPDPTPRQPMMLQLMKQDKAASLYVGRPCYNGFSEAEGCEPALWTSGRYSSQVVNSMAGVVRQELQKYPFARVNLFGHSGGGALALLIAEQLPQTDTVVTLAGNLDIQAWTSLHNYSPLATSLNPARRDPLPEHITQVHLIGERDVNIPLHIVKGWILDQKNSYGVVYEQFNHSCCWGKIWPDFVSQISDRQAGTLRFGRKPFHRPSAASILRRIGVKAKPGRVVVGNQ